MMKDSKSTTEKKRKKKKNHSYALSGIKRLRWKVKIVTGEAKIK